MTSEGRSKPKCLTIWRIWFYRALQPYRLEINQCNNMEHGSIQYFTGLVMAQNIQRAKGREKCGNSYAAEFFTSIVCGYHVVDKESGTNHKGYTEVITLQDAQRSREAWESGDEFFCADCSAANMVINRRSDIIDMGYTEVIKLQYDQRTKGHERRGKVEMNSFVPIVLRLTWLSIGDQGELTRASPNRPSCSTFRVRKIAQGVGSMS